MRERHNPKISKKTSMTTRNGSPSGSDPAVKGKITKAPTGPKENLPNTKRRSFTP